MALNTSLKRDGLASRLEAIRQKHRQLDDRVLSEQNRPRPDSSVLKLLKRERLRLKDEIECYEGLLRTLSCGRLAS